MSVRVLMLGWEFPPFITGGLGTACYGLTKAMDRAGMEVTFVLPKAVDTSESSHVHLMSPGLEMGEPLQEFNEPPQLNPPQPERPAVNTEQKKAIVEELRLRFKNIGFIDLPMSVDSSYGKINSLQRTILENISEQHLKVLLESGGEGTEPGHGISPQLQALIEEYKEEEQAEEEYLDTKPSSAADYGGDLIGQALAYAHYCVDVAKHVKFDVIHAHDWLTFPAGLAVARLSGRPLVVQVHSTEFDRSGEHVNQPVYNIERRGMRGAVRIIAVSELTKRICVSRYGISPDKIDVVYNGVDFEPSNIMPIETKDKIVLFFGRITMQKGPEYFLQAAKRVLDVVDDVKFVVAGSGDLAAMMIEMAADMGIGNKGPLHRLPSRQRYLQSVRTRRPLRDAERLGAIRHRTT